MTTTTATTIQPSTMSTTPTPTITTPTTSTASTSTPTTALRSTTTHTTKPTSTRPSPTTRSSTMPTTTAKEMTNVGLGQDCTHAHCNVNQSACVLNESGGRRCECVQNRLETVDGICKQAPTILVAKDMWDFTVKGNLRSGLVVGTIPLTSLADFPRLEIPIPVKILPEGSGISAHANSTHITLTSTSNTETTQKDIVLQMEAHIQYIRISQVVSVHIIFEETTVLTKIVPYFLFEGTRKTTVIGDTRQLTSRYEEAGYKLSIISISTSDIVQALFELQESGLIVLKKDVDLLELTGSTLVASVEISFQIHLRRDSASQDMILAVYHILILNDNYQYKIDENNAPNKVIMQNQFLGNSYFEFTALGLPSVLKLQNNDVLVKEQMDFEKVSDRETEFTLYVSSIDPHGADSTRVAGRLVVKDVNDESPHFDETILYLTALSGSPKGTILGVIPVHDQDTPLSGLTLTINGPYGAYFIIDNGGTLTSATDMHVGPSKFPQNFNFTVWATDGTSRSDSDCTVDVTITIPNKRTTNLNMSFPAVLPEESPSGTLVADVKQANYTNYMFTEREAYSYFLLNKTTGRVTTARPLDREKSTEAHTDFSISGHMEDQDLCILTIIGELHTTLTDVNDNSPVFSVNPYVKVKENVEPGYVLLEGSIQDNDEGINGQSTFIINDTTTFKAETSDGKSFKVRVHEKLDRETVSDYYLPIYAVDGSAGSGRKTSSTYLNIEVEDVNDNHPVFTTTATTFTVQENQADAVVTTLRATDKDAGLNGKVSFQIISGGLGYFTINNRTLRTTKGIDRETYDCFNLNIEAFDSGSPQLSTYLNITINMTDVNDNAPTFHGVDGRVFKVDENAPCSKNIVTVNATDSDTGENSLIVYSLGGSDSHMFTVDSHTGGISCTSPLDYETKSIYRDLIIFAADKGKPALTSSSTVTVKVLDVNDNAPTFSKFSYDVNVTNTGTTASIPLFLIRVHDADSEENGNVSLSIASSQYIGLFTIASNLIRLHSSPQLKSREYDFNVIAVDGGTPSLSATTTVTVHVIQSASNGLKFKETDFNLTATENRDYTRTAIGNVSVTNSGAGQVTFSIDAEFAQTNFSINNAGEIFYAGTFDRELQASYNFIVRATQQGTDDVAVVRVHVEDVNDNDPMFTLQSNQLMFSEQEDVKVNTVITTVTATDRDTGANGQVTYSLYHSTDFTIHPSTGTLKVAKSLDADDPFRRSYNLTITATDNGNPRRTSTVTATILVIDVNDNSPEFSSPTYFFHVKEDAAVNSEVGTMQATDKDSTKDTNGLVSYEVTSSQLCPFLIKGVPDPITNNVRGRIQVQKPLDYESVRLYTCIVTAHDNPEGQPKRLSTATTNITVEDVNDNVPFFLNEPYIANVSREGAERSFSFNVTVGDADSEAVNGNFHYKLSDDLKTTNPPFKIGPYNGIVSIADSLETVPDFFNLTITVSDSKHSNSTQLAINIIDNNQRPKFMKPKYIHSIREEIEIAKPLHLLYVIAQDDNKPTCNCTYEMDDSEYFTIESTTASVLQVKSVDREKIGDNVTLHITATDHGSPPKSTRTLLVINIVDINDNAPFFSREQQLQNFTVSKRTSINTTIGRVAFTDEDEPSTSSPRFATLINTNDRIRLCDDGSLVVTHPLLNPGGENDVIQIVTQVKDTKKMIPALPEHTKATDDLTHTAKIVITDTFKINGISGVITLAYDIDEHVPHIVNLTVKATDDAEVSKTGTCVVQITLEGSSSRQCYSPSELSHQVGSNTSPQVQFIAPLGALSGLLAIAIIASLVLIVKYKKEVNNPGYVHLDRRNLQSDRNTGYETMQNRNHDIHNGLSQDRRADGEADPGRGGHRGFSNQVNNPAYVPHERRHRKSEGNLVDETMPRRYQGRRSDLSQGRRADNGLARGPAGHSRFLNEMNNPGYVPYGRRRSQSEGNAADETIPKWYQDRHIDLSPGRRAHYEANWGSAGRSRLMSGDNNTGYIPNERSMTREHAFPNTPRREARLASDEQLYRGEAYYLDLPGNR
ncbi:protocadherin-16-like [Haliotis asinina]|uniref:protocadherin-16-like n=1 Tax=Haliotis asinina TaxID=109174 RepID=UPI00353182FF